jgi:hypothetical protein
MEVIRNRNGTPNVILSLLNHFIVVVVVVVGAGGAGVSVLCSRDSKTVFLPVCK